MSEISGLVECLWFRKQPGLYQLWHQVKERAVWLQLHPNIVHFYKLIKTLLLHFLSVVCFAYNEWQRWIIPAFFTPSFSNIQLTASWLHYTLLSAFLHSYIWGIILCPLALHCSFRNRLYVTFVIPQNRTRCFIAVQLKLYSHLVGRHCLTELAWQQQIWLITSVILIELEHLTVGDLSICVSSSLQHSNHSQLVINNQ